MGRAVKNRTTPAERVTCGMMPTISASASGQKWTVADFHIFNGSQHQQVRHRRNIGMGSTGKGSVFWLHVHLVE